jgi:heme exporter protein B
LKKVLTEIAVMVWKDILIELRTKQVVTSVIVFALLVMVVFNFAFGSGMENPEEVAPGVLWVSIAFGGVLGFNRILNMEKENSGMEGLLMCPVDRSVIYWGKLAGGFSFVFTVAVIITPVCLALFNLPLLQPELLLIVIIVVSGFAVVGTLFSTIAVNTRARDIMLPVLFLPVVVPVIISAVKASSIIMAGGSWSDIFTWLGIIIAFDIIYAVAASLVFEFVVEE